MSQDRELSSEQKEKESVYKKFLHIFIIFFKIGAFTFGGGLAMLPLVKQEIVDKKKWVSPQEFVDIVAVAMTAPGAIIINSAVYVGYKIMGAFGSLAAVLGAAIPSFTVILIIAAFFLQFQNLPGVEAVFSGIRPAVGAFIAAAVFKVGRPTVTNIKSLAFIISFLLIALFLEFNPILIIVIGVLTGLLFYRNEE
ncbi:chromate transporter [Candidatus Contubernalis alkaliaceticus]|uniref:chromate transporter n=1 Tax=Candidatus Contubernalis alkaliaceticus TaxID=338645 RepID=UPI001F4C07F5|nr:chromate transporter [Candidatus Contubernalis alkalaceticus]UNC90973.1 chromate transporter [Candidatus Contubernalis alkalaceticus]